MMIESGMDLPAYKFVAAVANSLLADHIVFQSYVSTSSPGKEVPYKGRYGTFYSEKHNTFYLHLYLHR
jgi:hypothetical protein